jgi:hypothetical protein
VNKAQLASLQLQPFHATPIAGSATPAAATPAPAQPAAQPGPMPAQAGDGVGWFFKTIGIVVLLGALFSIFARETTAKVLSRVRALARRFLGASILSVLISVFVLLNIGAVFYSNRPTWFVAFTDHVSDTKLSPQAAYRVSYAGWLLARYAHMAGLDNRWEMFSHQSRFNWWFGIQAITSDGVAVDLKLPRQGERTFMQRTFFDFREAKYHLNLYNGTKLRNRYGRYLCRQFPSVQGRTVHAIRFLRHTQSIRTPEEARALGTHLDPKIATEHLNDVACLSSTETPEHGGKTASIRNF